MYAHSETMTGTETLELRGEDAVTGSEAQEPTEDAVTGSEAQEPTEDAVTASEAQEMPGEAVAGTETFGTPGESAGTGSTAEAAPSPEESARESLPGIICWGDSLTYGWDGEGVSYPNVLKERIAREILDIPVVNMGACGEDSLTIAGRSGGIPYVVAQDVVIGENTEPVQIVLSSKDGRRVTPSLRMDIGINECSIAGIKGTLQIVEHLNPDSTYMFTRSTAGEAVTVQTGTEIVTEASANYADYLSILFVGTNGGYEDFEDLIAQQNATIASRNANNDRYLVVGMTYGTAEERREYDAAMYAAYGERYFNLREYLCAYGVINAGLTPTEVDVADMQVGTVPNSLRSDLIHLNPLGYTVMGNAIYEKLDSLGYFDEAKRLLGK